MLNNEQRLLISKQFTNENYCKSEQELRVKYSKQPFILFTSQSSQTSNCGDFLLFTIRKSNQRIEEIFFSRQEACIIVVAAANILCSWIIEKQKSLEELLILLTNIQRMVSGEKYQLADCQEIAVFAGLESFPIRKNCLLLVVDSFLQFTRE